MKLRKSLLQTALIGSLGLIGCENDEERYASYVASNVPTWREGVGIATGDMDGDGRLDALIVSTDSINKKGLTANVYLIENQGDDQYATPRIIGNVPTWREGVGIATGDMDGDGRLDALIVSTSSLDKKKTTANMYILFNNGDGTYSHRD